MTAREMLRVKAAGDSNWSNSNWGQIPIQDSHISGARGADRNWALTPIAVPERVSPFSPGQQRNWGQSPISPSMNGRRPDPRPELESDPNYSLNYSLWPRFFEGDFA